MKYLFLSPHTDDAELGCGATMARLAEGGHTVIVIAFSWCNNEGLIKEYKDSCRSIGVNIRNYHDFTVRKFSEERQQILDSMISMRDQINPDVVFIPSSSDFHQDHKVIYEEGIRAFKHSTIYCYELPWNNLSFNATAFFKVTGDQLQKKVEALMKYESQKHRNYMNADFVKSLAKVRGVQAGCEYAEAFEVKRLIQ